MPTDEQFDKEKAKAEIQSLDTTLTNDKLAPAPVLNSLPGVQLNGAEKDKYESEMAKLYKELDDKVNETFSSKNTKLFQIIYLLLPVRMKRSTSNPNWWRR